MFDFKSDVSSSTDVARLVNALRSASLDESSCPAVESHAIDALFMFASLFFGSVIELIQRFGSRALGAGLHPGALSPPFIYTSPSSCSLSERARERISKQSLWGIRCNCLVVKEYGRQCRRHSSLYSVACCAQQ